MDPTTVEILATVLFGLAILHTFSVKRFEHLAHGFPEGSVGENFFHLLGEVEGIFGIWAAVLLIGVGFMLGPHWVTEFLEGHNEQYHLDFTEPAFVFAIMTMAATRPILQLASGLIQGFSRVLFFLPGRASFYASALIVGPLLGSFITEPAAMTVTALILKERFYNRGMSTRFMYATLGALFVNVSVGGTLTHFAAPPVLMVAETFQWDSSHMLLHFGWKSAIAVVITTLAISFLFARELRAGDERDVSPLDEPHPVPAAGRRVPWWLILVHVLFMTGVVYNAHHMVVFLGLFMFFLGTAAVTDEYQDPLQLKEGLLVGFFLAGLVTMGAFQHWWLQPTIGAMGNLPLFLSATGLTAITDNAALTYLGSLVEGLSDPSKYALVAGAVAGGGLTVIANAPNPAGFGILKSSFGEDGISPLGLFVAALGPTLVAMACLWFLPN